MIARLCEYMIDIFHTAHQHPDVETRDNRCRWSLNGGVCWMAQLRWIEPNQARKYG
ncbi:hypothetical protein [Marinobacterium sp. BA1]|uniref:hypothetical protein n=1 Tax=Marinobacterium sp. BA1 TaxID=3138931 RepID=UPI0032E6C2AD